MIIDQWKARVSLPVASLPSRLPDLSGAVIRLGRLPFSDAMTIT